MGSIVDINYFCTVKNMNLDLYTKDLKHSQRDLVKKIKQIVHGVNCIHVSDENITKLVIDSFSCDGLIDTYNDINNFCEWKLMILEMVNIEIGIIRKGVENGDV